MKPRGWGTNGVDKEQGLGWRFLKVNAAALLHEHLGPGPEYVSSKQKGTSSPSNLVFNRLNFLIAPCLFRPRLALVASHGEK
jgi:hypothetical protein